MTVETANVLYGYFKGLYELNQNIIRLCGVDVIINNDQYEEKMENIIHLVPKLVPYVYNRNEKNYVIDENDGLLEFSSEINFLKMGYEKILHENYDFLVKTKRIRNQLEHRMHGAKIVASESGNVNLFEITYKVNGAALRIKVSELITFVKGMNILFSKIQKLIDRFALEQKKQDHPYYRRLIRFSFCDFNRIYESDLIRVYGKALFPF